MSISKFYNVYGETTTFSNSGYPDWEKEHLGGNYFGNFIIMHVVEFFQNADFSSFHFPKMV